MSKVFQFLNNQNYVMGYYEYISPYKAQVVSLLNGSDIYEIVEVEEEEDCAVADSMAYYNDYYSEPAE